MIGFTMLDAVFLKFQFEGSAENLSFPVKKGSVSRLCRHMKKVEKMTQSLPTQEGR